MHNRWHVTLRESGGAPREAKIERAIAAGRNFGHVHHISYSVAVAYALMDQQDRAMEWPEFTANDGFPCYPWFKRDPCLAGLRRDARFEALGTRTTVESVSAGVRGVVLS